MKCPCGVNPLAYLLLVHYGYQFSPQVIKSIGCTDKNKRHPYNYKNICTLHRCLLKNVKYFKIYGYYID